MKKVFSIFFAAVILLSGMHLSLATHFCGGQVADTKWSITGKTATCGMEETPQACPMHKGFDSNCCQNKVDNFVVDNNYSPSTFHSNVTIQKVLLNFILPLNLSAHTTKFYFSSIVNLHPPDKPSFNEVYLSKICVFRIWFLPFLQIIYKKIFLSF